jgi:lysyl-tRNA synthetase class 2
MNFYLRIATELPLKRLVVGGFDRVYEIGRLFRNEGVDSSHNPEFTTIEFYEANSDLNGMMERTEKLFQYICKELNIDQIEYDGNTITLNKPFRKITMRNSIKEITGVDFHKVKDIDEARKIADIHNVKYEKYHTVGHIIASFFDDYVEDSIVEPTFITEFPIEISPLAAKEDHDPLFTQRSELFICGREYANMFTELHDPIDQYERFLAQLNEKEHGNKEATEMDLDFVEALEYGMPPTGGCGIGIDRLIMLLTKTNNITDIILFPHLKKRVVK